MKSPAHFLRDIVAPSSGDLWQRAMQDEKIYEELPDGTHVPIFYPVITKLEEVDGVRPLYSREGFAYGTRRVFDISTDHGIDYASVLYQPLGEQRHDFYIDIDTPLATGVEGLNDEVASRLMRELGVPVLLKGPEFTGRQKTTACRLAKVALAATNISQSFSAETSMEISAAIMEEENLPRTAVVYGKSRGAMIGGKKYPYAQDRDISIVHYRLIDPCVGQRALGSLGDALRYGLWPMLDMAQSLPSFARFALEGSLKSRAKTLEKSPAYLAGMIAGTIPSLLSGETMADKIPNHKGVSLVHMSHNPIADTAEYLEQFKYHPNFDHHEIHDTHIGGIILPRNIRRTIRHLGEFATEYEIAGGNEMLINWQNVHNNPRQATSEEFSAA